MGEFCPASPTPRGGDRLPLLTPGATVLGHLFPRHPFWLVPSPFPAHTRVPRPAESARSPAAKVRRGDNPQNVWWPVALKLDEESGPGPRVTVTSRDTEDPPPPTSYSGPWDVGSPAFLPLPHPLQTAHLCGYEAQVPGTHRLPPFLSTPGPFSCL